ncbi:hypothetical protein [Streptomyces sp. NPDC019224]
MNALRPRLPVGRFAEGFRFYDAVPPAPIGAVRTSGGAPAFGGAGAAHRP